MSEAIDSRERRELCDLFLAVGPDAPTMCVGWTAADLAAHLVLREHFHRWPDDRLAAEKEKGFDSLVARLRAGPPLIPWRLPRLRNFLNGAEYFIHHEDVRRANGQGPRTDIADIDDLAWATVGLQGRVLARKLRPYALELVRPDGASRRYGSGPAAVLRGRPSELLLYVSGRRSVAQVDLQGEPNAVAAVEKS